ncbi:hypothetical protein A2572_03825 [Candidatus Collierbacteria bacterium RIFOXYD1_FULL_40_9]|uniref:Uncharacterized protein n=1 Tax=Candidatus Collierbacteria bacterium RIFOXYD1_FULL_40_9 TaxID=1817731 RepID=A0A1F5FU64_9BACT|nr:MAG: hypothetical protein A2572_03825 [Candidatus Collierbacteria bacterium RIFOXYD1_FULL_40_9]
MKNSQIIHYYGAFICSLLIIINLLSVKSYTDLITSFVYLPLVLYFLSQIIKKRVLAKQKSIPIKPKPINITPTQITTTNSSSSILDQDKRLFLKLIGSAGASMLFMALFTKKAQAAFFGSVPGPGTVSIKNSSGVKIDPAEAHPTDGYKITEIDDTSSPAYYGFVKKSGNWYIMREDSSGAYRYTKGTTSFSTNWTNRASLTYDYFNSIFS